MTTITLDWLHIVALLGALQGLFLAGVLWIRQRNRTANRVLAVTMLAFTISLLTSVYHAARLERVFPHFFGAAYPMPLVFGPLVYLYAVTASDSSRRLTWRDALHFVPFVLVILASLNVYLMSGSEKLAFYDAILRGEDPGIIPIVDPLKLVSGVTYATVTLLFLRRHRQRIKHNYSSLEQVNLKWLVRLAAAGAAIWCVAVANEFLPFLQGPALNRGEDIITLAIALLVYAIGYMALRQSEIYRFDTAEYPVPLVPVAAAPTMPPVLENPPPTLPAAMSAAVRESGERYARSGLSDREAAALKKSLLAAMDEKRPWRDADLTLADLSQMLNTTPHKLSEVLNAQLQQTFYDFVNGYRVRDVQRRIGSDEARNLTILSLALEAGFASKSTFNDVFKRHTGKTPSEYRSALVS